MFRKWMIGACVAVAAMAIGVEAEAQVSLVCPSSVRCLNYSTKATKVKYVSGANQIEGVVAPKSMSLVCPSFAGGTEDSWVSVKAGNLPAQKFKISAKQVQKLYERSGFTPDEAGLIIDVSVNKNGFAELKRFYLGKRVPE